MNLDGITPRCLGNLIKNGYPETGIALRWEFEFWNELHHDRYVITVTTHDGEIIKFIDDEKLMAWVDSKIVK